MMPKPYLSTKNELNAVPVTGQVVLNDFSYSFENILLQHTVKHMHFVSERLKDFQTTVFNDFRRLYCYFMCSNNFIPQIRVTRWSVVQFLDIIPFRYCFRYWLEVRESCSNSQSRIISMIKTLRSSHFGFYQHFGDGFPPTCLTENVYYLIAYPRL